MGVLLALAVTAGLNAAAAAEEAKAARTVEAQRSSVLKDALAACSISNGADAEIGDGGYTLTVNGKGNDDISGLELTDIACLQSELKTPQSVISHLDQTTSLDGRQTESWGLVTESWSYHPDRGLDSVFTIKR